MAKTIDSREWRTPEWYSRHIWFDEDAWNRAGSPPTMLEELGIVAGLLTLGVAVFLLL